MHLLSLLLHICEHDLEAPDRKLAVTLMLSQNEQKYASQSISIPGAQVLHMLFSSCVDPRSQGETCANIPQLLLCGITGSHLHGGAVCLHLCCFHSYVLQFLILHLPHEMCLVHGPLERVFAVKGTELPSAPQGSELTFKELKMLFCMGLNLYQFPPSCQQ